MKFILKQRVQINKIDKKLVKLLEKRFKIVNELKKYKKKHKIPMQDLKREKQIKTNYKIKGTSTKFINDFFDLLFKEDKKK